MVQLVAMQCGQCGIEFAVPDHFDRERRDNGGGWFCPNGHERVYRVSKVTELTRERDRLKQDHARLQDELAAVTRVLTQTRKRQAGGACPCCKRSFVNMARHMKTKHPGYAADGLKVVA